MDPFVPKHGPRPTVAVPFCAYSPTGREEDDCAAPATWHVMWDGDFDNSFTCDTHMKLVEARWMFDDRHPVGPDCGMPGALWLYSKQRCGCPDEPTVVQAAAATPATPESPRA